MDVVVRFWPLQIYLIAESKGSDTSSTSSESETNLQVDAKSSFELIIFLH